MAPASAARALDVRSSIGHDRGDRGTRHDRGLRGRGPVAHGRIVVFLLVSVGLLIAWIVGSVAANVIVDLPIGVAALLGGVHLHLALGDQHARARLHRLGGTPGHRGGLHGLLLRHLPADADMAADEIVPITFAIIIGAGIIYGFDSPAMARGLRSGRAPRTALPSSGPGSIYLDRNATP